MLGRSQPAWTVRISVDELWQAPLAGLARIGRQVAAQTPAVQAAMLEALRSHAKRAGSSEFLTVRPSAPVVLARASG